MDAVTSPHVSGTAFLDGGGELGRLIAAFDWSKTSAGPIDGWSVTMKTTVGLILRSPIPIVTLWGEKGVMVYNDAYAEFAGPRHPDILGKDVLDAWPEVADWNRQVMETSFHRGETLSVEDQELVLYRRGVGESVYLNLDYSPVPDEGGKPVAVIAIVVETTAKVRAERQLQNQQARLERMFQQAPGFIGLLEGPEHRFAMANQAYTTLVGGRELVGFTVAEALPEVAEQGFITLLDQVYGSGKPFIGHATPVVLDRGDGAEERFVDFVYQPILGDDGAVTGIFVQGHDVTEQQLAARALRESEERFRLVAERAPVMLWMTDIEGHCLYLNKPLREFWGIEEEDSLAFDWGATVHPDDRAELYGPYADAMREHRPYTVEARYKRIDGAYRRFATHAEPRFDATGEFIGMIGVNIDVTDTREVEERYRRIFEQASDLILTADLDQRITDCNPAAAAAVGLTREQAIGRTISEFISPEDFARTTGMLQSKLDQSGGTTKYDVRVRSSNGDWLFWEINSGLTFDDAGNPVGLHVVARDVTERKTYERHQQLFVGELNHRVKNTLAIVQSLSHQSFNSGLSGEEAIKRFEGRLQALAAAHNLLTQRNWEAASIRDVVDAALAPFCSDDRCKVEGPNVNLPPATAVSLALALHELATNAAKYGSLSVPTGTIAVRWTVGDMLDFCWSEHGGPPVRTPDHRGFGTRMIERTLAAEFGGTVTLCFEPEGLTCRVQAPVPAAA